MAASLWIARLKARGNNSLKQSLSGTGYTLQNDINSQGKLRVSTSSAASTEAASLSQNVGGIGSMSLNMRGAEGDTDAGQEASVAYGSLASSQSLSAGQGIARARAQSWPAWAAKLSPELWERIM